MVTVPSRAEEIAGVLRTEILRGQYRAGERLPSERDLAARFESNRGAIREAIKKLEQLGITAVTPGGVRVLPIEEATLEVLGYLLELGEIQRPELIGQMLDVLASMMALSTRSAIDAANDEQIHAINQIVENLIVSVGDQEKHSESWKAFGELLISIHENLVLRLVGNGLKTQFMSTVMTIGVKPNIDPEEIKSQLQALQQAADNRQSTQASNAIIEYFRIIKTALVDSMTPINADQPSADKQVRTNNA